MFGTQPTRIALLTLLLGCGGAPPEVPKAAEALPATAKKSNKRKVLMKATPVDPLGAERGPPVVPIVNVHEHVMGATEAPPMIAAMDNLGIERTVILGAPIYTFLLGKNGFTEHDANNMAVIEMAAANPERLIPFVVAYPEDADAVEKLKGYIALGAKGVKLFAGHGAKHGQGPFHTMPLDDPRMEAIYAVIEAHNLPVLFHVNYRMFETEFESVLTQHPNMKVLCPHYCLTLRDTRKIRSLLTRHRNLWMDISFGWIQFQAEGYRRIDKKPKTVAKLFAEFPDRFTFGTDLVITSYESKDAPWITMNMGFYRDLVERESYAFYGLSGGPLHGLNLPEHLQKKLYQDNAIAWLDGPPMPDRPPVPDGPPVPAPITD